MFLQNNLLQKNSDSATLSVKAYILLKSVPLKSNIKLHGISEKAEVRYVQRWEELAYAREDGKEEGIKEGIKEGEAKGRIKGEARINKLGILLKEAGRTDDFLKSLSDEKLQQELIVEFGLQEA